MSQIIVYGLLAFMLQAASVDEVSEPVDALGSVTGTLTSGSNGRPAPGVAIYIADLELGTRSGEGGRFTILNVPPGQHVLTVEHPCFMTVRIELEEARSRGAEREVNMGLPPRAAVDGNAEPLGGCHIYRG